MILNTTKQFIENQLELLSMFLSISVQIKDKI